jgi:16S rRNA (uracil1498-N3)-methyltransferase
MSRFFYTAKERQDNLVFLAGDDAHHLLRVLRSNVGDGVELCDETGRCHLAVIAAADKKTVTCQLAAELPGSETSMRVFLAFGLLKGEKTDFVLQKATELGVAGFLPFISQRTVSRPEKKTEARLERWQKIIRGAAGQSRRSLVPTIEAPCSWQQLLTKIPTYNKTALFWEGERDVPLRAALDGVTANDNLLLITGPEGGLSKDEVHSAAAAGAHAVTLGPRILRAETAALTAVAVSLYQVGEMGG